MRSRRALTFATLLLSFGCGAPAAPVDGGFDAAVDDAAPLLDTGTDAGPQPVSELSGTDPTLPDDDLAALAPLVGDALVVGIGESVHTTGGEVRMRTRLIRYLVTHHDFRTIAFEGSRTGIEAQLASYLDTCAGTPEDAAFALNPIWWDRSTPELLAWLCEWNTAHPSDRVGAFGFDVRQPWTTHPALRAYLERVAPADAASLADGLSTCLGVGYADEPTFFADPAVLAYFMETTPLPQAGHDACEAGASAAIAAIASHRAEWIGLSSERELELARLSVVEMLAFDESIYYLSRGDLAHANPLRDVAMADGFETLRRLDHPSSRIIVWAHDGHVMRHSDEVTFGQWVGVPNMMTLLEARGALDHYLPIGQLSRTADIDWTQGRMTIGYSVEDHLEALLDGLGLPFALVDVAAAEAATPPVWDTSVAWGVGFDAMFPSRHYGALVFHHHSPANDYFELPPWHVP